MHRGALPASIVLQRGSLGAPHFTGPSDPDWRGFALTRLQAARGPLMATLIVSVIHALWHLPAHFIKGAITSPGEFEPTMFVANSLAIIAGSFVWTWLFNNAAGSIFFATLVHAASNAMSGNLAAFLNLQDSNLWFAFGVSAIVAVLVIVLTRGRLAYSSRGTT